MNQFQVFKYDGRMKHFRLCEGTSFRSTTEEHIKHLIDKYCFASLSIDREDIFIPELLYHIKINEREVSYFDSNYNPFYFE